MMQEKSIPKTKFIFWGPKWLRGLMAFMVGCLIIETGLQLLEVRIEWFSGLATFSLAWVVAMLVLPITAGVVVGFIYGFGGKYLAHFPPVLVLCWAYYESVMHYPLPEGIHLLPWPLWAFYLILQMEFCALGGVIGEIIHHSRTGWDSHLIDPSDGAPATTQDHAFKTE